MVYSNLAKNKPEDRVPLLLQKKLKQIGNQHSSRQLITFNYKEILCFTYMST